MTAWEKEGHGLVEERASERVCGGIHSRWEPRTALPVLPFCVPLHLFISWSSHSQASQSVHW